MPWNELSWNQEYAAAGSPAIGSGGAPSPELVQLFRSVRQDARNDPKPTEVAQPFTIAFPFDGVAPNLPTVGDTITLPLGKISGKIIGAAIVADGTGSATIDVRLGNTSSWPNAAVIYDTLPTLTSAAAVELSTSNWHVNLQPGDILVATLKSVSGSISCVTFALECSRRKWPTGAANIVDSGGNTIIDTAGDTVTQRG